MWQVVLNSFFEVIGSSFSWRIIDRNSFKVEVDPWASIRIDHILPQNLVNILIQRGCLRLAQLTNPRATSIKQQGRLLIEKMDLVGDLKDHWNLFLLALSRAYIGLTEEDGELMRIGSPHGSYSPKEGYVIRMEDRFNAKQRYWQKVVQKAKCPTKAHVFMWCLIMNKVST